MKVGVVIPSRGLIFAQTVKTLHKALSGYDFSLHLPIGLNIPDCFNVGVLEALDSHCDYIWIVEEDMLLPGLVLDRLFEAEADIALCDYPDKKTGKKFSQFSSDGFEYSGIGCCLIKAEVFKKMEYPYFRKALYNLVDDKPVFVKFREPGDGYGGHDVHFYQEAKRLGFSIEMINEDRVGHMYLEQRGDDQSDFGSHRISIKTLHDRDHNR